MSQGHQEHQAAVTMLAAIKANDHVAIHQANQQWQAVRNGR